MNYASVFIMISLLFVNSVFASDDRISVSTEKGEAIHITGLKAGHSKIISEGIEIIVGHDNHGNPIRKKKNLIYEFIETLSIPFNTRDEFGFEFILPAINHGDELIIKIVIEFPEPILIDDKINNYLEGLVKYSYVDSGQKRTICWQFQKDKPVYHINGNWTLSLLNNSKLLIKKKFNIQH